MPVANASDWRDGTPARLAVYDPRLTAGRAFAAAVRAAGVEALAVSGDVTEIWEQRLRQFWDGSERVLFGVTSLDALFCLDVLARDAGYRLVGLHGADVLPVELQRDAETRRTVHLDQLPRPGQCSLHGWVFVKRVRR